MSLVARQVAERNAHEALPRSQGTDPFDAGGLGSIRRRQIDQDRNFCTLHGVHSQLRGRSHEQRIGQAAYPDSFTLIDLRPIRPLVFGARPKAVAAAPWPDYGDTDGSPSPT